MTGTGQGPILTVVTPSAVGFLPQNVGTTSYPHGAYVENTGNTPVSVASLAISGANAADFQIAANTCIAPIDPNYSCSISVTFSPGAIGARSAVLTITDNASGSPQTVALRGTGQAPVAALSFFTTALNFGVRNLKTTTTLTVNVNNSGNTPVSFGPLALSGENAGDFSVLSDDCASPLAAGPGSACQIYVNFTPTAVGERSANLSISDTAAGSPQTITSAVARLRLPSRPRPLGSAPQPCRLWTMALDLPKPWH